MNVQSRLTSIKHWMRLHLIAVAVLITLVLAYTLLGFLLVPRLARDQVQKFVTEQLHRQVRIGEIRFNPYVFDASVDAFALNEADGSALVSFRHLYVNLQLASLWRRAIVLHEVELSAPDVTLIVDSDGQVNLAKLQPPEANAPSTKPSDPP